MAYTSALYANILALHVYIYYVTCFDMNYTFNFCGFLKIPTCRVRDTEHSVWTWYTDHASCSAYIELVVLVSVFLQVHVFRTRACCCTMT